MALVDDVFDSLEASFGPLIDPATPASDVAAIEAAWQSLAEAIALAPAGVGGIGATPNNADGYVAFFTGPDIIAGDNDFFFDRPTNQLQLNQPLRVRDLTTTPASPAVNYGMIYLRSGIPYFQNSAGTEFNLTDVSDITGLTNQVNDNSLAIQHLRVAADGYQSQIDSHLANISNPHSVTPSQVGNTTAQWNADSIHSREVDFELPQDGELYKWDSIDELWKPSFVEVSEVPNLSVSLDGYVNQSGVGADGYISFFVDDKLIAGDNDLFWDRANNRLKVPVIQLDINRQPPTHQEGQIYWDPNDKTISAQTDKQDVTLQIGQEMFLRVTNKTGLTITNGQVVYINGAQGNRPTITLAKADAEETSMGVIGVVTSDIEDNGTGYATTFGLVRDLDTSTFSAGDVIFLSATTAGAFVNVKPATPNHNVNIGRIVRSNDTDGVIFVSIDTGFEINDLHDVQDITPTIDNAALVYDTGDGYYKHQLIDHTTLTNIGVDTHDTIDLKIDNLNTAADGYVNQSGIGADGYVSFFVGDRLIAGDNDLYFDRANNKLIITNLQITTDAETDYILKADAQGNATWQRGMDHVMVTGFNNGENMGFMFWSNGDLVYHS